MAIQVRQGQGHVCLELRRGAGLLQGAQVVLGALAIAPLCPEDGGGAQGLLAAGALCLAAGRLGEVTRGLIEEGLVGSQLAQGAQDGDQLGGLGIVAQELLANLGHLRHVVRIAGGGEGVDERLLAERAAGVLGGEVHQGLGAALGLGGAHGQHVELALLRGGDHRVELLAQTLVLEVVVGEEAHAGLHQAVHVVEQAVAVQGELRGHPALLGGGILLEERGEAGNRLAELALVVERVGNVELDLGEVVRLGVVGDVVLPGPIEPRPGSDLLVIVQPLLQRLGVGGGGGEQGALAVRVADVLALGHRLVGVAGGDEALGGEQGVCQVGLNLLGLLNLDLVAEERQVAFVGAGHLIDEVVVVLILGDQLRLGRQVPGVDLEVVDHGLADGVGGAWVEVDQLRHPDDDVHVPIHGGRRGGLGQAFIEARDELQRVLVVRVDLQDLPIQEAGGLELPLAVITPGQAGQRGDVDRAAVRQVLIKGDGVVGLADLGEAVAGVDQGLPAQVGLLAAAVPGDGGGAAQRGLGQGSLGGGLEVGEGALAVILVLSRPGQLVAGHRVLGAFFLRQHLLVLILRPGELALVEVVIAQND